MDGEGTVPRLRKDGRWEAKVRYTDRFGKPDRVSVYGKTFEECRANVEEVRKRLADDMPAVDARDTLANWSRHWRENTVPVKYGKKQTRDQYANLARVHVERSALLADMKLKNIRPSHVEGWLVEMSRKAPVNARDKSRRLSASTIRTSYTVLRAMLDIAVRDGLLAKNPVAQVKRPKVPKGKSSVAKVDAETVARVIEQAQRSRYYNAIRLTALMGTRIGETLGLRWRDIDDKTMQITLRKQTTGQGRNIGLEDVKSDRSARPLPLTAGMLRVLKAQRTMLLKDQLRAGDRWSREGDGLVFRTELGTIVDDRYVLRAVKSAAKRAGIDPTEKIVNHTLRHTAGQTWLEEGIHIKAVSDLLGHSSIAITGDIYGHTSDEVARKAMDALGRRLTGEKPEEPSDPDDGEETPDARHGGQTG